MYPLFVSILVRVVLVEIKGIMPQKNLVKKGVDDCGFLMEDI